MLVNHVMVNPLFSPWDIIGPIYRRLLDACSECKMQEQKFF